MVREFFNEKAAIWDKEIAEKDITKLDSMVQRLDIKSGSTVLDVGTGTGIFVPYLLKKLGDNGHLIAIDIAEQMLVRAKLKFPIQHIDHIQADVVRLPLYKDIFDTVVCYSSFPHFHDKQKALIEMARVLKINGMLFICHTTSRSIINGIHKGIPAVHNDLLPEYTEIHRMFTIAGFEDIIIEDSKDTYLAAARKVIKNQFLL